MKYSIYATCNYPDDEVDTPTSDNLNMMQVHEWIGRLFNTEPDMTSAVVVISKQGE